MAECVIREGLEWGWCQWVAVLVVRSGSAAGHGRLKLGKKKVRLVGDVSVRDNRSEKKKKT